MSSLLLAVLFLVLAAEFVNGWTDAPNAIATVVSTRVLPFRAAILLAVALNIIGAMCGTAVAATIGKGIVDASVIDLRTVAAALIAIIAWSTIAARVRLPGRDTVGIPTSESHALVAGLTGAALATAGWKALLWNGWQKVIFGLAFSSVIGFTMGILIAKGVQLIFAAKSPTKARRLFDRLQIFSAAFMAFNHGLNDGQKFIGVFTLALVLGGILPSFQIPLWVIILCAVTMGVGTSVGGKNIIGTLGMRVTDLTTWQGFSAEAGASLTILGASAAGIPLSTTHTITTSIMGVGASRRVSAVRWSVVADIALAWIFTFPVCGAIAYVSSLILKHLF